MRIVVPGEFETFHLSAVKANPGLNIPPFQDYVNNTYSFEGGDENAVYDQAHVINVTMAGETELTPVLNFKCKRRNISDLTDLLTDLDFTPWFDNLQRDATANGYYPYVEHIKLFIGPCLDLYHIDQSVPILYDDLTKMVTLVLKAKADNPMWYGSQTLQLRGCDGKGVMTIGADAGYVGFNDDVSNYSGLIQPMGSLTNPDIFRGMFYGCWHNPKPVIKAIVWGNGADFSTQRIIDVIMETKDPLRFPNTMRIGDSNASVLDYGLPTRISHRKYLKKYSFNAQLPIGGVGDALPVSFSAGDYWAYQP